MSGFKPDRGNFNFSWTKKLGRPVDRYYVPWIPSCQESVFGIAFWPGYFRWFVNVIFGAKRSCYIYWKVLQAILEPIFGHDFKYLEILHAFHVLRFLLCQNWLIQSFSFRFTYIFSRDCFLRTELEIETRLTNFSCRQKVCFEKEKKELTEKQWLWTFDWVFR